MLRFVTQYHAMHTNTTIMKCNSKKHNNTTQCTTKTHQLNYYAILDPEGGSQNATLVVVVGIGSLKMPKAFLICSAVQRTFAYTFVLIFPTDQPYRIFKLISN